MEKLFGFDGYFMGLLIYCGDNQCYAFKPYWTARVFNLQRIDNIPIYYFTKGRIETKKVR